MLSKTFFALALVTASVVVVVTDAQSPVRDDPRCAARGQTCEFLDADPNDAFHADSSTCTRGQPCPTCVDPQLAQQAAAIVGDVASNADIRLNLQTPNWLTAEMIVTIFHILSKEVLGFDVKPYQTANNGFQSLCCGGAGPTKGPIVQLEGWPSTAFPEDDGYFSMLKIPVGYEGASGIFVKERTVQQYPLATSANAYIYLPEYRNIFPRAFEVPYRYAQANTSLGPEVASNFHCAANAWPNTTCGPLGRYVPPQCEGDKAQYCQEIIHAMPTWDAGYFEALIKNAGLNFTIVYVGYGNQLKLVDELQSPAFYWWEPDSLVAKHGGQQINFKPTSAGCQATRKTDPTLSGIDCAYPRSPLFKAARRDEMNALPQLKFLFESFSFGAGEINQMLAKHSTGGGTANVYNISCEWVNANYATWSSWLRSANPPVQTVAGDSGLGAGVIAVIVILPLVAILAVVVAAIAMASKGKAKSVEFAPTTPPLALIFTDVESSTFLWDTFGATMGQAMEVHHEVIRGVMAEYECYEVKVVGDAFMVACPTAADALAFCMECQRRLEEADWPEPLVNWKNAPGEENMPFRGLRVRMGFHHCEQVEAKFDDVHQGYDYYGPDVNMTARVQSVAKGGQVLISSDTYEALRKDPDFELLKEETEFTKFASGVELKGVPDPVLVYSLVPMGKLAARRFGPIEGAKDETTKDTVKGLGAGDDQSTASSMAGGHGGAEHPLHYAVNKIFSSVTNAKEREALLAAVAKTTKATGLKGSYPRRLRGLMTHMRSEHERTNGIYIAHTAKEKLILDSARQGSSRSSSVSNRGTNKNTLSPAADKYLSTSVGPSQETSGGMHVVDAEN